MSLTPPTNRERLRTKPWKSAPLWQDKSGDWWQTTETKLVTQADISKWLEAQHKKEEN